VLRSKVAVFVDLWTMHTQLADRAAECEELRAAVDDSLELLDGQAGDPRVTTQVRERLAEVRDRGR
jgi:hypothetical protein